MDYIPDQKKQDSCQVSNSSFIASKTYHVLTYKIFFLQVFSAVMIFSLKYTYMQIIFLYSLNILSISYRII